MIKVNQIRWLVNKTIKLTVFWLDGAETIECKYKSNILQIVDDLFILKEIKNCSIVNFSYVIFFDTDIIAYCHKNRYVRLNIYTDLFGLIL